MAHPVKTLHVTVCWSKTVIPFKSQEQSENVNRSLLVEMILENEKQFRLKISQAEPKRSRSENINHRNNKHSSKNKA